MEQLPIGKLHPFNSLPVQKTKHLTYEKTVTIKGEYAPILCPTALVGIEIEVEKMYNGANTNYYWNSKPDGSLRDSGIEFASIPLRGYQIPYALEYLFESIKVHDNPYHFSPRTSIHVHLNVRDMTWEQIKSLVLLYSIFEKHFFSLAGTKREASIYCVPLYKTTEVQYLDTLETRCGRWHKYSAINLGTMLGNGDVDRLGTIEFRHLYGTDDINTIINWINNIFCLRQACIQYSYEELYQRVMHMNTTSEYFQLYEKVFKDYANTRVMMKQDFEHCITQTKLNLLYHKNRVGIKSNSPLFAFRYGKAQKTIGQQLKEKLAKDQKEQEVKKLQTFWKTAYVVNGELQVQNTINGILADLENEGF